MTKILIIDEDSDVLRLLYSKLNAAGYEVAVALDGAGAQEQLDSFHPEIIVMETLLPDVNGYDLISQIRARDLEETLIIVLSSKTNDDDIAAALSAGAADYMTKPFSPISLLERIRVNMIRSDSYAAGAGEE